MRRPYGAIIRLGLPILASQVGMIVVGFADTLMVGRYASSALAAASFVNSVFTTAILACVGFCYGLTPLIGALYGRGDSQDAIGATVRRGAWINGLFGLLVTALMGVMYAFLDHMGQPRELMPLIKPYFLVSLAGMVPVALFNAWAQWSYAINNSAMPMWIILGANAVNILGNWLLIYGALGCPEMGLLGAGLATLAARTLCMAAIIAVFCLTRVGRPYRPGFRRGGLPTADTPDARRIVRTSLPVCLQMTFETGSFSMAAIMTGWIGAAALGAYQIMLVLGSLGFCVYCSIGSAVAVYVSNATATADASRCRSVAWAGYHLTLAAAAVACVLFLALGRQILGLFTTDPQVLAVAMGLIGPLVLYQLGDATQVTFANALRGTSHVVPMMWIALVSYVLVGLPAAWIMGFPLGMGIDGIFLSFTLDLMLAAALYFRYFRRTVAAMGPAAPPVAK